jgi:hypothetical protein
MRRAHRLIMLGAVFGSAGVLVLAAAGKNYPGVLPKPLFATPGATAYCYVDAKNRDNYSAELFCWTPDDGWAVWIDWRGRRAETGYFIRPPQIVDGLGVLRGYKPRAQVLRFGETRRIRCGDVTDFSTCPSREGVIAFTCTSRSTGLTCRNAAGHGYWIGRYRGYRLF